jgi:hypothetical protein
MLNLSLAYKIFSSVRKTAADKSQQTTNLKQIQSIRSELREKHEIKPLEDHSNQCSFLKLAKQRNKHHNV